MDVPLSRFTLLKFAASFFFEGGYIFLSSEVHENLSRLGRYLKDTERHDKVSFRNYYLFVELFLFVLHEINIKSHISIISPVCL